jgi:hypothetical protein
MGFIGAMRIILRPITDFIQKVRERGIQAATSGPQPRSTPAAVFYAILRWGIMAPITVGFVAYVLDFLASVSFIANILSNLGVPVTLLHLPWTLARAFLDRLLPGWVENPLQKIWSTVSAVNGWIANLTHFDPLNQLGRYLRSIGAVSPNENPLSPDVFSRLFVVVLNYFTSQFGPEGVLILFGGVFLFIVVINLRMRSSRNKGEE